VRNLFPQVVVATHSVEIVADLDPADILIVDRSQSKSRFADTLPAVQRLIDRIGGVHNVKYPRCLNTCLEHRGVTQNVVFGVIRKA
jgi:hypothetical protein